MKKEYDFAKAKRGAVVSPKGKTRLTIYLDTDVVDEFRVRADEAGYGCQTMINEALRQYLEKRVHRGFVGSGKGNQSFQLWSHIANMPPFGSRGMPDQGGLVTIDTPFPTNPR